ncbi:MAG TPA: hypothetical protein VFK50_03280 [Sphingomicrobium sp.]|nr:hypothetical protein [Sphingomicrobium sp.]
MHSHRRPRGRIFFETVCALTAGVSFVGAWIQTGAWAFIGPAFVFTLFGLYWAIDLFGKESAITADEPAKVPAPAPVVAPEPARVAEPEIRFQRFEATAEMHPETLAAFGDEPEARTDVAPFISEQQPAVEAAPVANAERAPRARKSRAKKSADPVVEQAPAAIAQEPAFDHHIEQLFDPQPFARQARPAFGKRNRGPGSRPLPAT